MAPKYPSIPEPTIAVESLRDAVLTIKQAFEVLTGQRGNQDYRAVLLPEITAAINNSSKTAADNAAAIADNAAAIATKVAKAGDTMTGNLVLTSPAKVSGTAKGHLFGTASGPAATSATPVAVTDANILLYYGSDVNWAGVAADVNGNIWFRVGTTGSRVPAMFIRASDQSTNFAAHVLPTVSGTLNLGSASLRWGTVYTSDLSLKNDYGDWTIVEGEDDLFLYNNKKNRVYKFALVEVERGLVPPKKA